MTRYGVVEIGGTKVDLAMGTSPADLTPTKRIPTKSPDQTLSEIISHFHDHDVDAVGVACFGPLLLDRNSPRFGTMLKTPKPGWSGTEVFRVLRDGLGVPVGLETDVNGAALGEGRWGSAAGIDDYVYVTVGTGIGGGVVIGGTLLSGGRHPEVGHTMVGRLEDDDYAGRCPYHSDCVEGLASGPALEDRFGGPSTWAGNEAVLRLAGDYVARLVRNLNYTIATERVIVGGGVAALPGFHERVRHTVAELLGDYPTDPDLDLMVSPPGLGELSGLSGALVLAQCAHR